MINLIALSHLRKRYEKHYKESEENGDFDTDFATANDMLDTIEILWRRNHIAVEALRGIKTYIEDQLPIGHKKITDWKIAEKALRDVEAITSANESTKATGR